MKSKSFKDLIVWQKAHKLVLSIYSLTRSFPKEELYGLTSQMRRSAISVPANIAEGFAMNSKREKIRFYNISQGSLEELKYFILLSNDLEYPVENYELFEQKAEEVSKLLSSYINAIKQSNK